MKSAASPVTGSLRTALRGVDAGVAIVTDPRNIHDNDADELVDVIVFDSPRSRSPSASLAGLSGRGCLRPVVVVCDRPDPAEIRSLVAAGASGVVSRDELEIALVPTVNAVRAGLLCLPKLRGVLGRPVLSIREKQVIGLVAMGLTNREVADQLFLAESTVKSHLSSAFGKLGVHSRHEAIDLIVDPESGLGTGILALVSEPNS